MKKATSKKNNNKIQLKIKSQSVTNNFILSSRTPSASGEYLQEKKGDGVAENLEVKTAKQPKHSHKSKLESGCKKVHTDRLLYRKSEEEDIKGHPSTVKKLSLNTYLPYKKKSSHSLLNSERSQSKLATKKIQKKRFQSKTPIPQVQQFNIDEAIFHRVLGAMISDYKDGKISQLQLEETLMQLYQKKSKKRSKSSKGKRKKVVSYMLSNDSSSNRLNNTAVLYNEKRKKSAQGKFLESFSSDQQEIQQKILQRKDFVNQIIIKGITTSLFLKEDFEYCKESDAKQQRGEQQPINLKTSNSVQQLNNDIFSIRKELTEQFPETLSLQEKMAVRIQRAWRNYRTRKVIASLVVFKGKNNNNIQIEDFTDEEVQEKQFELHNNQQMPFLYEERKQIEQKYSGLLQLIRSNLSSNNVSKKKCLDNICSFLNIEVGEDLDSDGKLQEAEQEDDFQYLQQKNQNLDESEVQVMKSNRILEFKKNKSQQFVDNLEQLNSKELEEQNSFTNKYSSKQVIQQFKAFYNKSLSEKSKEQSLLLEKSYKDFKEVNIQSIEDALINREQQFKLKKDKQLEELCSKLIDKKVTRESYQKERQKIDKWFKSKLRQISSTKKALIRSCKEAQSLLKKNDELEQFRDQKNKKMIKCLSDQYIFKNVFNLRSSCEENVQPKVRAKVRERMKRDSEESSLDNIQSQNELKEFPQQPKQQGIVVNRKKEDQVEIGAPKMQKQTSLDLEQEYSYQEINKEIEEESNFEDDSANLPDLYSQKFIQNLSNSNEDQSLEDQQFSLLTNLMNDSKKKFKYLCNEDKEDIFEFVYLDLVLEMFTQHTANHHRIMKSIETYLSKQRRLRRISKGFKTNLNAVKDYLRILYNHTLDHQRASLNNLSIPMGPSALEMLRYMHDQFFEEEENEENISTTLILPVKMFEDISKVSQSEFTLERYYDDEEREQSRLAFLKTAFHIHNKALFDSINEMLDHERPYGVWGKPFPWKKAISSERKFSPQQQQNKLKKSIQKSIESCSYVCGIMVDKQDSIFLHHRVSEEYVYQIREDRISKMLANDLIENEERWIFYDDEYTEILVETAKYVYAKVVKQLILELTALEFRRQNRL